MEERRGRGRYQFPNGWVKWEQWTFWHRFRSKRIADRSEAVEAVCGLVDIASGGVAFAAADPPPEGSRLLLNVFMSEEADPIMIRGIVLRITRPDASQDERVAVRFEHDLAETLVAKFRALEEASSNLEPAGVEDVQSGEPD